jgi:hypothetical protein
MWGRQAGAGGVVRADSTMPRPTYPRGANGAVSRPSSRFGQLPPEPVDYTPTEPLLVVEVDTGVCLERGRWRRPTVFRRLRLDMQADEVVSAS